jgi:hypothetical protein
MTTTNSPRKKVARPSRPDTAVADDTPENLDKVRDILFGGQMRAVDQRLAALEERMHREVATLQADIDKRLVALESYVKKELELLAEKLKAEQSKRSEDLKALGSDLKEGLKSVERRLAKLDDTSSKADADLRTAILEQTKNTTQQLQQLSESASADLQRAVLELRGEKLDTASLVQLFSDMAVHLTEDLSAEPEHD